MASPTTTSGTAASLTLVQRTELLQVLVQLASGLANKQLDAFATRMADAMLRHAAEPGVEPEQALLRLNAGQQLKKNRYPFYYVASERVYAALERSALALHDPSSQNKQAPSTRALPPDLEVDCKLSLMKAARAIDADHAARLAALNMRLAQLLGLEQMESARNPFRAHVFLTALHEAWCEFHPDAAAHHLLFQLLGPELCLDMGPILHALNMALIKRGIAPNLALAPAPAYDAAPAPEGAAPADAPKDPLAAQLRRLFPTADSARSGDRPLAGALPSLFNDSALQATVSRDQLLAYLSEIQKNGRDPQPAGEAGETRDASQLARIKRWAQEGSLAPADANTIALLIPVFDAVLGNKSIASEIKALIGSLQVPVLKAALADKDFFFNNEHPARRAIDLLAQLSVGWERKNGAGDPLYQAILRNVKRIQSDQRTASFVDAVDDITDFMAGEASSAAASLPIARALEQEKRLQAARAARHEVALRIGTGEVVAFVETFLEDKWVKVLTLAYTVKDDKPHALDSAVRTMDELCWSVKPKITQDERKDLVAKLPSIIAMLNKWLDLIKWTDEARVKFFDELARCHASIVRAPLELSPERQMQIALAVAKRAAERREQRLARQPQPVPDAFDDRVRQLECGAWMEFVQTEGAREKLRLAWISPTRSLFIFANRQRQEALSLSDEDLARALREQRAHVALDAGMVGRALVDALAGSANQDAPAGKAAA